MWLRKGPGKRGQTSAQLRAELERVVKSEAALQEYRRRAEPAIAALQRERDEFRTLWLEADAEAGDGKVVVTHLHKQIEELTAKIAELEEIAVPHVEEAEEAEEPIYTALRSNAETQQIELPPSDVEPAVEVKSLAAAGLAGVR